MLPIISLAHAHIRHRRYMPKPHAFSYQMGYLLVNTDCMADACDRSPLWSYNHFNIMSFYDRDLLSGAQTTIRSSLRSAFSQQLGQTVSETQPIFVLTLPRYLGLAFNPVSFYWVYDEQQTTLQFIAAHITNTPWHERFLYCFSCDKTETTTHSDQHTQTNDAPVYRFIFDKQFHVSPFMPMQLKYDWRFKLDANHDTNHSAIHMQLKQHGQLIFDATMQFTLEPLPAWKQHLYPLTYPLQSIKIVWAIYWQALFLLLKKIPFFTHPSVSKEYQ